MQGAEVIKQEETPKSAVRVSAWLSVVGGMNRGQGNTHDRQHLTVHSMLTQSLLF